MGKKNLIFLSVLLLFASFIYASKISAEILPLAGHKIVLDPGHGGDEPGSTACEGLYEEKANWDIAVQLKEKLESDGATVFVTRDQNYDNIDDLANGGIYDNEDRYTWANTLGAEVLVAIHLNGSSDTAVNGTTNFYTKPKKDKEFTSVMHTGMADYLDQQVVWSVPNLGITNFMYGVTLRFNGPAVLSEPVFISNTNECNALKAKTRQADISDVLYNGLLRWFGSDYESLVIGKK